MLIIYFAHILHVRIELMTVCVVVVVALFVSNDDNLMVKRIWNTNATIHITPEFEFKSQSKHKYTNKNENVVYHKKSIKQVVGSHESIALHRKWSIPRERERGREKIFNVLIKTENLFHI